jgi:signal transduction histidine kinase
VGLRGRFTAWFALSALIPIGVAALVTREVVTRNSERDFTRRRAAIDDVARGQIAALAAEIERTVAVLASRDHPIAGGLLLDLDKHGGELPDAVRRDLRERLAPTVTRGQGLDLLYVIDGNGTVLAAPHYRPAVDETDTTYRERARRLRGAAYFAEEPMLVDGEVKTHLVVESVREWREGAGSVVIVGGRIVRPELLGLIRPFGDVDARVLGTDGAVWIAASGSWADMARTEPLVVPLRGADGATVARLEVGIADADLRRVLRRVTWAAVLLAGAAVVVTVLLGFFVARGMTRHLDELVTGAQAAARGDLDHRVPVRTSDEIGAVAAAFNSMMTDVKDANERLAVAQRIAAWQEIARRLAHEIKNPLTPIQMSVETLRKTWAQKHASFDEIFEESTSTILEEAARLKRIVGEFSEFARMPRPEKRPVDLNAVVSGTLALYKGSANLVDELAPDLPVLEADRDQLAQVVLNLVENAREAIAARADRGQAGRILVQTCVADGMVQLIVEDNGPGVAAEIRDKIFTPYFTTKKGTGAAGAPAAMQAASGTGLGLAIVYRIVTDHGGRIAIAEAAAGGARFVVSLPSAAA